jgi:6-phosphogluconolactonase (cycloisomerase 2 family)
VKALLGALAVGLAGLLSGCAGFFPATTASGTTAATTGDYVYVVNQTTNTVSEFSLASSALTAISGSPISLSAVLASLSASSIVVSRANSFVYVGGQGGIACFSIGSTGALTAVTAGNLTSTGDFVSLDTSPDGKWLVGLDSVNHSINIYGINTSTGVLTLNGTATAYPLAMAGNSSVAEAIRIAPTGAFIAVALGTAGDVIYPFTTSTGVLSTGQEIQFTATGTNTSDNALAFDSAGAYLYIGRLVSGTGNSKVATYSVSSAGVPTAVGTAVTGDAPFSILIDSTGKYLYTANRGSGNVSGYSIASGVLTALSGSPYASGLSASALVEDNSDKYLVGVASNGSYDYTLYSFDALTAGKLDAVSVGASGSDPAGSIAVAATH